MSSSLSREPASTPPTRQRALASLALEPLRCPAALYMVLSFVAVASAKARWNASQAWASELVGTASLVMLDLALLAAAAALALALSAWRRSSWIVTAPLGLLACLTSVINGGWIDATGSQLGVSVIAAVLESPAHNLSVALDEVSSGDLALLIGFLTLPAVAWLLPFARRRSLPSPTGWRRWAWSGAGALCCAVALAVAGAGAPPRFPAARSMSRAGLAVLTSGAMATRPPARPAELPLPEVHIDQVPDETPLPNVVMVFFESLSYRASSLGEPVSDRTPFLAELTREGLSASQMRSVIPHTTKALFPTLCGVYPAMQQSFLEHADNFPLNCLPEVLGHLGYSTVFFQSANGEFEARPRSVNRMGFQEFHARQTMGLEMISFVNGDDLAMGEQMLDWAREARQPFLLTALTSLTHTPYDLPSRLDAKPCTGKRADCEKAKYHRAVSETDAMIRRLYEGLEQSGLAEDTIFVVFGDHGEAFGEHGERLHDNVYYDEGLRVPFAIRAPGRVRPGAVVDETRSLLDTYPTLLSLIGIPYDRSTLDGISLLERQPASTRRYFSCWYDDHCYGFVEGSRKVVRVPRDKLSFAFDLARDPGEMQPIDDEPQLPGEIAALEAWIAAHREQIPETFYEPTTLFHGWRCVDERRGNCDFDYGAYAAAVRQGPPPADDEGLLGRYYRTPDWSGTPVERVDHTVDFSWARERPMKGFPADKFSVRWEGCLITEEGEAPRIVAGSDDGMEVWLDGNRIIDLSGRHRYTEKKAYVNLQPGLHPIRLDFSEWGDHARAFLGWTMNNTDPRPIPAERLVPLGGNSKHECPRKEIRTGTPEGPGEASAPTPRSRAPAPASAAAP